MPTEMDSKKTRVQELGLDLGLALVLAAGVMLLTVQADRLTALLLPFYRSIPPKWLLVLGDVLGGMDLAGALLYFRGGGRLSGFGHGLCRAGFFFTWLGLFGYLWDRIILREYQLLQAYRYPFEISIVIVTVGAALIFLSRPFWRFDWPNLWTDWLIRLYLEADPSGKVYYLLRSLARAKHMADRYVLVVYNLVAQFENTAASAFDKWECELRQEKPAALPAGQELRQLLRLTRLREALADHIAPAYLEPRLPADRRLAAGVLYDANRQNALQLSRLYPAQKQNKPSSNLALACYQGLDNLPPACQAYVNYRVAQLSSGAAALQQARAFLDGIQPGFLPGPEPGLAGEDSPAGQVVQRLVSSAHLAVLGLTIRVEEIRAAGDLAAVLETCLRFVDLEHAPDAFRQAVCHSLGYAWWDIALQVRAAANKTGYPAAAWQNAVNCFTLARRPIPLERLVSFTEDCG